MKKQSASAITIRDFVPEDLSNYIAASTEFYHMDAVLHPVSEENFHLTFAECLKKNPFTRGLTLLYEGQYAGYGLLSFTWSNEVGGVVIFLEEAYILPQFQGHGIGSAYIGFVEREYADTAKRFRLEVTDTNVDAIRLYERLGYQRFDYMQMVKENCGG